MNDARSARSTESRKNSAAEVFQRIAESHENAFWISLALATVALVLVRGLLAG